MAGGALENLHPNRGIGAGIAEHTGAHRGQLAIGIAPCLNVNADRMSFGVQPERLLTREGALHRPLEEVSDQ